MGGSFAPAGLAQAGMSLSSKRLKSSDIFNHNAQQMPRRAIERVHQSGMPSAATAEQLLTEGPAVVCRSLMAADRPDGF